MSVDRCLLRLLNTFFAFFAFFTICAFDGVLLLSSSIFDILHRIPADCGESE